MTTRNLTIAIVAQAMLSGILAAFGSYVSLQITGNNVTWIENIQTNHELRIEALERRAYRDDPGVGLLYQRKVPTIGRHGDSLAFKVRKPLPLERPGVQHTRTPFDALGRIQAVTHEPPAVPLFGDYRKVPLQFQTQRQRRHGRDPPTPAPAAGGISMHGKG